MTKKRKITMASNIWTDSTGIKNYYNDKTGWMWFDESTQVWTPNIEQYNKVVQRRKLQRQKETKKESNA